MFFVLPPSPPLHLTTSIPSFHIILFLFPMFFLFPFILLIPSISSSSPSPSSIFLWAPSNSLSDPRNWVPSGMPGLPRAGGNLRLDSADESADQDITLALLNGPLQIRKMVFPSNGILYFGPRAELGNGEHRRPSSWQYEKRPNGAEDAIFSAQNKSPNFFDAGNWQIQSSVSGEMDNRRTLLDAEKVPSDQDRVEFPVDSVSKVFIDVPARVNSFNASGQAFSVPQLRHVLFSVEGQFRFRLGSRISIDHSPDSGPQFEFRWPVETVFDVREGGNSRHDNMAKSTLRGAFFGRPNSNFFEPQFSALCGFVRCLPVDPYCSAPIQPIGQCCPHCGALLKFRQNSLNFTHALALLGEFNNGLPPTMGLSLVRGDKDDFHPLYQLSALPTRPEYFTESFYHSVLWSAFWKIQRRSVNVSSGAGFFDLRPEYSIQKGLLHFRSVLTGLLIMSLLVLILALAFRDQYRRSPRLRLLLATSFPQWHSPLSLARAVSWRRTRESVQLIGNDEGEGPEAEEEENGGETGGRKQRSEGRAETGARGAGTFLAEFENRAFAGGKKRRSPIREEEESDAGGSL